MAERRVTKETVTEALRDRDTKLKHLKRRKDEIYREIARVAKEVSRDELIEAVSNGSIDYSKDRLSPTNSLRDMSEFLEQVYTVEATHMKEIMLTLDEIVSVEQFMGDVYAEFLKLPPRQYEIISRTLVNGELWDSVEADLQMGRSQISRERNKGLDALVVLVADTEKRAS
ncbi:hypothetical protein M2150_001654 [Lachnospiraceae bacterium PM6-15]|uniref:hypothetical protein n=1 Tax=Ohessyouella blattaphilus TaxID=2949333 RepID=UPI003E30BB21